MQEHNQARQEIAAQLRQVRKEQGMTQERLAEKVGTRKSNISRLESGRYNPSLDFLEKVAGGLGREIEVKVT
jgi:transcriptional regulator with XRE-family HTH domain